MSSPHQGGAVFFVLSNLLLQRNRDYSSVTVVIASCRNMPGLDVASRNCMIDSFTAILSESEDMPNEQGT
jgi:hypothetical protein